MTVALFLPTLAISRDEEQLINVLRSDIVRYAGKNAKKYALYEGEFVADQIGIAVPPMLKDWPVRIGWGTTVIDVISERMNWIGFDGDENDLAGLDAIADRADLSMKMDQVVQSTLTTGTSFAVVGTDSSGNVLIEQKSPSAMAVRMDWTSGTITAALSQIRDDTGSIVAETLYRPDSTVTVERKDWKSVVTNREDHGRNMVPVVQFRNQPNDSHPNGRSLITAPIEYAISAAARTILGMEVHREFFSAPQRAALGAEPEVFGFEEGMDEDEKRRLGWSLTMGRMNIVPPSDDGRPNPTLHEFAASAPSGYIEILRHLALMVSSDAGIPPSYIGVHTDNPASADSIKALESRIERRTLSRIRDHNGELRQIARLALSWRDGSVDEDRLSRVRSKWASPSTPTPSAAADAGMKLVSAGILPPDSTVTYDRIGLSQDEQRQLAEDKRRAGIASLLARLPAAAQAAGPNATSLASQRLAGGTQ